MSATRILLPLDLRSGTTDTLLYLQRLAMESLFSVTLLHVVNVNIVVPDRRLYPTLCAEAQAVLRRLSLRFLGAEEAACLKVRVGRADEQILAEASTGQSELILMSNSRRRGWRAVFGSHTAENVMRAAPCPILIVPSRLNAIPGEARRQPHREAIRTPHAPRLHPTWA